MTKLTYFKACIDSPGIRLGSNFSDIDFLSKKSAIDHVESLVPEFFKAYPTFSIVRAYLQDSPNGYLYQIAVSGSKGILKMITFQVKEITLSFSD